MYNTLGVNPAYAGSRDALTITGLYRTQWVGFDGAPTTQTLTAHSPVTSDAVNLGLSFSNDEIGPVQNTALYVDYAFRFKLTENSKLALGVKVGFDNYNFNLSELQTNTGNDPAFMVSDGVFSPNFGFGIYYNRDNFYAGLSTPKILENDYAYSVSDNLSKEKRHYYLIAGGIVPISNELKLKPTGLLKCVQGAPVEIDLTANFLFYDRFQIGAMYRTGDAFGLLAGFYITDQLSVGYSFDWSMVNTTSKYNDGSHEIVITYDFIFKESRKIRSPRYFTAF
jgi:type IX secretion system PorP/SprF family membrane protein